MGQNATVATTVQYTEQELRHICEVYSSLGFNVNTTPEQLALARSVYNKANEALGGLMGLLPQVPEAGKRVEEGAPSNGV